MASDDPTGSPFDVDLSDLDLDLLLRQRRGRRRLPADEDQRVLGQGHRGAVVEAQARRRRFCGAQGVALEQDVAFARGPPRHGCRQLADVARDRHDLRREPGRRPLEEDAQALSGEEQVGILHERIELMQLAPVLARSEEALGQPLQRVAGADDVPAALPLRPVVRRSAGLRTPRRSGGGGHWRSRQPEEEGRADRDGARRVRLRSAIAENVMASSPSAWIRASAFPDSRPL